MASPPVLRRAWRWPLIVIVGLVVLGAVLLRPWLNQQRASAPTTVDVVRGDIEQTVTAVGALQPKDSVEVGTQVSGRVERIHVEINDRVSKGQLIAELDDSTYRATVESDRADIDALRAQLRQQQAEAELARRQLERNQTLIRDAAISQDTLDQSTATLAVADAQIEATRAQLRAAQATLERDLTNLGYTKIYSPMDGSVVSQTTLEGQTVNANQSTPVIVGVANLDVMTVWAQVTEADINKIRNDLPAYFTTLGMPQRRWQGTVRQVQPTPEIDNDVVLYNVLIDVDNPQGLLLPDMTVQVFFVLAQATDVTLAPLNALKAVPGRGEGPRRYRATVLTASGPEPREVEVGVSNRLQAQIVSGLQPGEQLIVETPAAGGDSAKRNTTPPRMMGPRL